jgi:hypothetical protein
MRHQRLRVVATVEFPPGFKDEYSVMLMRFKAAVMGALKEEHLKSFGTTDWPVEIHAVAGWSIGSEETKCASV